MIYDNLSSIVCIDSKGGIGNKDGTIPWHNKQLLIHNNSIHLFPHIEKDLLFFKDIRKKYNYLIVGRKTFSTLPYFSSNNFLILTKENNHNIYGNIFNNIYGIYTVEDLYLYRYSLIHFLCIGGASIYNQTLPNTKYLYLSQFKQNSFNCECKIDLNLLSVFNEVEVYFEDDYFKISKLENNE